MRSLEVKVSKVRDSGAMSTVMALFGELRAPALPESVKSFSSTVVFSYGTQPNTRRCQAIEFSNERTTWGPEEGGRRTKGEQPGVAGREAAQVKVIGHRRAGRAGQQRRNGKRAHPRASHARPFHGEPPGAG